MKLFVTILEETMADAIEAVRAIALDHDGIEIRAERFPELDARALRAATAKPIILTRRGLPFDSGILERAVAAGIDLVDVELARGLDLKHRDRIVLSHHDFDGMPDVESLVSEMRALGCAHVKIAVTPKTFGENERLLKVLEQTSGNRQATTVIGMGERGLYSRLLAPFRGSGILFVGPHEERTAAPGQISLERALAIYGDKRSSLRAERVFALVGNPAGHSLSPTIHNPMFRSRGVPAAYTIASVASFDEITDAFLHGEPCGLSITAPFKQDAFAFARALRADIGENAAECQAANTLVRLRRGIIADNTDVDGFALILERAGGRRNAQVGVIGAGGTARAAIAAIRRAGMQAVIFNRTESRARRLADEFAAAAEPLAALDSFRGEIIVNTTTAQANVPIRTRDDLTLIEAAYGDPVLGERHERLRAGGVRVFDGLDLLKAQAVRQNEMFMRVFDES